jgi:hypothetical protein
VRLEPARDERGEWDGWRVRVDCADACGATAVVTVPAAIQGGARCMDCGRRHHGAPVPARPVPGSTRRNGLPLGQPGTSMPGRLDPDRLTLRRVERAPGPPALDEGEVATSHPAVPANAAGLHARATVLAERSRRRLEPAGVSLRLTRTVAAHLVLRVRAGGVRGWFGWTGGRPTGGQFLRPDGSVARVGFLAARAYLDGRGVLPPRVLVEPAPPKVPTDPQEVYARAMVRYGTRGLWFAAGTSSAAPYPCRCFESRDRWACQHGRCPCWGRTDVANLRAGCCAFSWFAQQAAWQKMINDGTLTD